jgi:hypothetical protein
MTEEKTAHVQSFPNGWHLVQYGNWEVSVAADGLLMFPRHIHPRDINDFVGTMLAAAEVATKVIEENEKKTPAPGGLPSDRAILTEGPPPPGAARMITTQRSEQAAAATIGRPKRRNPQPQRDTRQRAVPPPKVPRIGAPNGQQKPR